MEQTMRNIILTLMLVLMASTAFAVTSEKPSTHDTSWMKRHGKASMLNMSDCTSCHVEKVSCVKCHQEVPPRSHTSGWKKKGHGLEARWDRATCAACHKEDTCVECHKTTPPASHRPGWREPLNRHCTTGCHFPVQETTCFTCHKTAHAPNQYSK